MEKTNVRRLVGVLLPFVITVIVQRLGYLVFDRLALTGTVWDTLVFLIASAVGIFFFRMSCGEEILLLGSRTGTETSAGDSAEDDGVPPFPERDSLLGRGLCTLVCLGALVVIMYLVIFLADEKSTAENIPFSAAELAALVGLHPLVEEYLFRWLYYRELRPMHPIFAALAQAVMFAIVHDSVGGMMYALFAGIAFAVALETTGSLGVAVLAHALVNLRSYVFMTWLAELATVRYAVDFVLVSVGFGAFLVLLVRRGLQGVAQLADAEENDDAADEN